MVRLLFVAPWLCVASAAVAQPPKAPPVTVDDRASAPCFNCKACGDACACFGGGYYCSDTKGCSPARPIAVNSPTQADGGIGDLPNRPAPAGQEWKRYPGEPWKLFPLTTAAPAVAAPRPFSPAAPTTATTAVPLADTSLRPAPGRGSSAGATRMAPTGTYATPAETLGFISGCPPRG